MKPAGAQIRWRTVPGSRRGFGREDGTRGRAARAPFAGNILPASVRARPTIQSTSRTPGRRSERCSIQPAIVWILISSPIIRTTKNLVTRIDTKEHNWLNFEMSGEEKIELFLKGARAAFNFLLKFNWEEYKEGRRHMARAYQVEPA